MKCLYCDKEATWYNPHEHAYYCQDHAVLKMKEFIDELNQYESSTLKDWFIKVIKPDPNLINVTLNVKTGEVTKNADNSW